MRAETLCKHIIFTSSLDILWVRVFSRYNV